jgi:predicted CxxxxCH...CXXCH cytochrome family protein
MVGSGSPALSAVTIEEIMAVAGEFYLARTGDGVVAPGTGTGGGTTPPANSVDGQAIFSANCTGCHTVGTTGTSYSELAGDGSKVTTKFDGGKSHNGNTLSADEIIAVATYFDSQGGATDPGTGTGGTTPPIGDRSGQQVFDQECANCHAMGTHDTTSIYGDLAGLGTTIIPKIEGGHQSKYQVVTAGELTALADFADTFAPVSGGGSPPACGSCHSLPPTGSAAGAHAVHWALNGVGTSCSNCHPTDAVHPSGGLVDLGFASVWDAKSGPATDNLDGTCSNIICHGGKKTPVWGSGTIDVDTQCTSCHASGTSQYNSYSSTSGKHGKHLSAGIECSECHEPAKLQIGHFTNLSTPGFEQSAASTLQNSLNYTGTSCNPSCHSSERW